MNLDRFSPAAFEVLAGSAAAARDLAAELQDAVAAEVEAAARDRFMAIAAALNQYGHRLAAHGRPDPDEDEFRDYTDPNQCALRLAVRVEVTVTAGYKDVRFEGGWGEQK
jgi:hypothetical protein